MKLIKYSWVLLFGIFLSGFLFGSNREITISRATSAPKIDGYLDDLVWRNGVWFTDFKLISDPSQSAKVQTEFQMVYDDEYLYVAVRAFEPEPQFLKMDEFRKDGAVCYDDSIELMIDPYGNYFEYYHFITNPVGIRYDARRSYEGEFHQLDADPHWKVATKIDRNEWTVEMAIPFVELNLNTKSKGPWNFNLARHRQVQAKEAELSSFSPMQGGFHIARKFSKLNIPDLKVDKFFWGIKRPFDYHIEADKGEWVLVGKVQIKNDGSPDEKFKLLVKQINSRRAKVLEVLTDSIPIGEQKEYTLRLSIEKEEPLNLQFEIVNAENINDLKRIKKIPLVLDYRPLSLKLIIPAYRNTIYSSENIKELKILMHSALPSKILNDCKLQIRLFGANAMNLVNQVEVSGISNTQEVTLPIGDLAAESYIIEACIVDSKGDIIAKASEALKKLKHEEHEWRLNSNGALLHNGNPFLPKGWLGMLPDEKRLIKGSFYDTLFIPGDIMPDEQEAKQYLDSVLKAKSYAIMYPYPSEKMVDGNQNLTSSEVKEIKQRIKSLKNHPALMAWVTAYEPDFELVPSSRIRQVYSIIRDEDPFHPVVIVNSSIRGIMEYLGMADIMMPTTANTFLKGAGPIRPLNAISYYLDMANKIDEKNTAFWSGLQANDYSNSWNEFVRIPTFLELRNMLYQAIIQEVKGCFWNNYLYTHNYPEVKIGVEHLAKELILLESAVLSGLAPGTIEIDCENKPALYFSQREVGKDKYFFAVNTASSAQKVNFDLSLLNGVRKLYVLSENRTVEVQDGKILNDYFEPCASHIYCTRDFDTHLPSLGEVQNAIDLANRERKKHGNLAFEDGGVKITASSSENMSLIGRLNDGVFNGIAWKSSKIVELPQWIQLNWAKPIKIEKVVLHSDTIEHATLQVQRNGIWVNIAEFKRRSSGHLKVSFKEIEVDQIRILVDAKTPGANTITVSEIEVYNSLTKEVD